MPRKRKKGGATLASKFGAPPAKPKPKPSRATRTNPNGGKVKFRKKSPRGFFPGTK